MVTGAQDRQHYNIAIFVAVKNDRGEYLLQLRQNTAFMNGYWDFAASGHLERGETLQQSIVREAQEEADLVIQPGSLKLVHVLQYDVGGWPYVDFLFFTNEFEGEASTNEQKKVADLQWFAPKDFPENLTVAVKRYYELGFPEQELTYSYIDEAEHERLTGVKSFD